MSGEWPGANCALVVRDLRRSFGSHVVHRGVSFDLRYNEILALMGTSGGGKSLILKSIVGLEKPDSGKILFEGENLSRMSERALYPVRSKIAYVFQNGALFDSLTVEENLSYPLRLHTDWSDEKILEEVNLRLEGVDLAGTNDLYPSELSGGMEKRVGLVRATMLHPSIALLDEPTAGLDPAHVGLLLRTAKQVKEAQKFAAIFVTHDIDAAFAIADRIAILNQGVIHAIGASADMDRSEDPVVRSVLHPDFGGSSRRIA